MVTSCSGHGQPQDPGPPEGADPSQVSWRADPVDPLCYAGRRERLPLLLKEEETLGPGQQVTPHPRGLTASGGPGPALVCLLNPWYVLGVE